MTGVPQGTALVRSWGDRSLLAPMVREDCLEEEAGMTLGLKGKVLLERQGGISQRSRLRSGDPEAGSGAYGD